MTDDQTELLRAHFERVGDKIPECPICGHKHWSAQGPVLLWHYDADRNALGMELPSGVPVALVLCTRCYYARAFALGPIMADAGKSLGRGAADVPEWFRSPGGKPEP